MRASFKLILVYDCPGPMWFNPNGNINEMTETLGADGITNFGAGGTSTDFSAGLFTGLDTQRVFGEHAPTANTANKPINHLFPFNGSRRFRTDVIYYPVNTFYVVDNVV